MLLRDIRKRIVEAEMCAGRPAGAVRLIAVSKRQPDERVCTALNEGHRLFGENTVQEAAGKWPDFLRKFGDAEVHLVGPLQTNKVRRAMGLFAAIHSLDRPKLARTLGRLKGELGQCPQLFVQVNTGGEPQKSGVAPGIADAFIAECRDLDLPVIGLMCIPPTDEDPDPHFTLLREIADRNGLENLSMGMSGDFERAVELGATHVRVGSAIFGPRERSQRG